MGTPIGRHATGMRIEERARQLERGLLELERQTHAGNRLLPNLAADAAELVRVSRRTEPYVQEHALRLQQLLLKLSRGAESPQPGFAALHRQLERILKAPAGAHTRTGSVRPSIAAGLRTGRTQRAASMADGAHGLLLYELDGIGFALATRPVKTARALPLGVTLRFRDADLPCFPEVGTAFLRPATQRTCDVWVVGTGEARQPYVGLRVERELGLLDRQIAALKLAALQWPHRMICGSFRHGRRSYYLLSYGVKAHQHSEQ